MSAPTPLHLPRVRVNCVAPGVMLTSMGKDAVEGAMEEYSQYKLLSRRPALAEDIAKCIVFMSSPASSFIYAATIDINGGRDLR